MSIRAFILKNVNWEEENGIRVVSGASFVHHKDSIVATKAACFTAELVKWDNTRSGLLHLSGCHIWRRRLAQFWRSWSVRPSQK